MDRNHVSLRGPWSVQLKIVGFGLAALLYQLAQLVALRLPPRRVFPFASLRSKKYSYVTSICETSSGEQSYSF
jgi:hypothetical protein